MILLGAAPSQVRVRGEAVSLSGDALMLNCVDAVGLVDADKA